MSICFLIFFSVFLNFFVYIKKEVCYTYKISEVYMNLGKKLKQARLEKKLTQKELAKQIKRKGKKSLTFSFFWCIINMVKKYKNTERS